MGPRPNIKEGNQKSYYYVNKLLTFMWSVGPLIRDWLSTEAGVLSTTHNSDRDSRLAMLLLIALTSTSSASSKPTMRLRHVCREWDMETTCKVKLPSPGQISKSLRPYRAVPNYTCQHIMEVLGFLSAHSVRVLKSVPKSLMQSAHMEVLPHRAFRACVKSLVRQYMPVVWDLSGNRPHIRWQFGGKLANDAEGVA